MSTASSAPASCASSASAAMSHTSVSGLVGVSANSNFVFGLSAARHSATSVCETKAVSTPNLANSLPNSFMVLPKTEREQTTWSPAFSRPMPISRMADMPLAVATAASAPSSAARRRSNAVTLGLLVRL